MARPVPDPGSLCLFSGEVKLGDFGASIVVGDALRSSFIGSIHWMAPEVWHWRCTPLPSQGLGHWFPGVTGGV